jgi:hypothetical protein
MALELSGVAWVDRFPTSQSTSTLADGFRQKCEAFLAAIADAGATVSISATLRPPERAYLMHWSYAISAGEVDPEDVPRHSEVEIEWVHKRSNGSPDLSASRAAAAAMVHGYEIVHEPSLKSLHIFGKAIDMSITWDGLLKIKQKNGTRKTIRTLPRSGLNHDLWAVGATYGMLKLASDAPHWSSTGH